MGTRTELPPDAAADEHQLFELMEAVEYVARHDDARVVIRDGRIQVDHAERN